MLDSHAHAFDNSFDNAFVCTASIPSKEEAESLLKYRLYAIGSLPGETLGSLDDADELLKRGFHLGEVGLDRRFGDIDKQLRELNLLLDLTRDYDRCVVFHSVGHFDRIVKIIKEMRIKRFMVHSFQGSYEIAKEILKLGGLISISNRFERCKSFNKVLNLPFVTESDMKTSAESIMTLTEWNDKLSRIVGYDVATKSERLLLDYING